LFQSVFGSGELRFAGFAGFGGFAGFTAAEKPQSTAFFFYFQKLGNGVSIASPQSIARSHAT
jgi:hypothetical protein